MKRCLDASIAAALLVLLAPLFAVLAVLIRIRLGSPVLFVQERPGLHSAPFRLVKFRSMTDKTDDQGRPLPDAQRMTRLGRFLRATSLDELPELWNVLKGEMSLVGPRPLLMEYLPRYTSEQARRHDIRPGITGWAQINGRNAVSWTEKFEMDIWYVDHHTIRLDALILWRTIGQVVRRHGISAGGDTTMPKFMGRDA
jgi:sugar transferase EpsL